MQDGGDFPKPTPKDSSPKINGITKWHHGNSAKSESYQDKLARKKAQLSKQFPKPNQPEFQSEPDSEEVYGADSERFGWPKNWKDIFNKDTSRWGTSGTEETDAIYQDPDHLLSIHPSMEGYEHINSYASTLTRNAERVYWRYTTAENIKDDETRSYYESIGQFQNFQPAVRLSVNVWDYTPYDVSYSSGYRYQQEQREPSREEGSEFVITRYSDSFTNSPYYGGGETGNRVGLVLSRGEEGAKVAVFETTGKRNAKIFFNSNGEVESFAINVIGRRGNNLKLTASLKPEGWDLSHAEGISTEDIELKDGIPYVKITRSEGGSIVDEFVVRKNIDVTDIEDLFPDELERNPENPNAELDQHWKTANIKSLTGFHWTPVADDSRYSLTPIPEPAPEDSV